MKPAIKCVNLDWLEVFCLEPFDMPAQYFQNLGWQVNVREYGTPLYKEMFTLVNEHGKPFLEIRRNPYSLKENGGIFEKGSCHIRLANRTLYTYNPIQQLQEFLSKYKYTFKGITRIDIACDQLVFDNGMDPQKLIEDYMAGSILKNRNSRINVHGSEKADGRNWNSIKWGAASSPLSTKIYDKTLELKEASDKLYIKDSWVKAGLCDLQKVVYEYKDKKSGTTEKRSKMVIVKAGTKTEQEREIEDVEEVKIWRVEFSIKSEARNWITIDNKHVLSIGLTKFQTRERCLLMFLLLSKWCLNFVKAEYNEDGQQKRKDRCTPIILYSEKNLEKTFKPHRVTEKEDPTRTQKIIYNRLVRISNDNAYKLPQDIKDKCLEVAHYLTRMHGNYYMTDEQMKRAEEIKKEIEKENEIELVAMDTFESLDWIEKWKNNTLTRQEKSYIQRYKHQYMAIFLKRAEAEYVKANKELQRARTEIDFWSGKTMQPEVKEILYDLPF